MSTTDRLSREQEFHDRQARERYETWSACADNLRFDDDAYLEHEPWIRPALDWLGDVREQPVLDLGCGHGMAAVVLARRAAHVTGLDLSSGYLREARTRAQVNRTRVHFLQASGERLPFADRTFTRIWGHAILHHLELDRAARELRRVLRPGGVGVFCEPWGENPLLNWARRCLPYPGKNRTVDEQPLTGRDLTTLCEVFPTLEWRGFQLLSMASRVVGHGRGLLEGCDRALLRCVPGLRRYCRYVVVRVERPFG